MFVDVGLNRNVLETLSLSFVRPLYTLVSDSSLTFDLTQVYDEVVEDPYADTGGNEEEALTGVINIYFPEMKKWIFKYLSEVADKVSVVWCQKISMICCILLPGGCC